MNDVIYYDKTDAFKLEKLVSYFFIYSFFGWVFEELIFILFYNDFVFRGFLYLPILPIYGFGAVIISSIFPDSKFDVVSIFIISFIICSLFEYISSYLLESIFNISLWDYYDLKYNLNGRVSLISSIYFSIACVLIVKVFNPIFERKLKKYRNNLGLEIFLSVLIIVSFIDFCLSCFKYLNKF